MVLAAERHNFPIPEMAIWRDFTLEAVKTSLFTPTGSAFASGQAVAAILPKFRERFDGPMQALPLPADVPAEIPRVVLQSSDGAWQLQMAPARIDCLWNNKPGASPDELAGVVQRCVEVLEHYIRELPMRVGRVALVVYRTSPVEKPAQVLIQRFCNEASQREPFNRSETFEIHNHKPYTPKRGIDYAINSLVRCKSAAKAPDNRPIILVEQDLNSLAQDLLSRRFTADEMRVFFETTSQEANDIFRKYFPEQETP